MLARTAYDTVCHEHIEYYGFYQIEWILARADLRAVDVEFNDTNGGSFSVTATPLANTNFIETESVARTRETEISLGLMDLKPYQTFAARVAERRAELLLFVQEALRQGKRICAAGASTKGNVLLQYTGLDASMISAVAEINPDKFGCVTPGTKIPIVEQASLLNTFPDYLLVLPWHFRDFFVDGDLFKGQTLLFPLPIVEVIKNF